MSFHSAESGLSLHQLHAFTFTSAANLSAGSPSLWNGSTWVAMAYTFTSADQGKVALLLGDGGATQFGNTSNSYFELLYVTGGVPTWSLVTSAGSESSGINYITNGLAAQGNTTGWSVYQDAAGASPVSGNGAVVDGTPITFVASSSSPLRGTYSFLLSRPAANKQGEGAAFAFTIDAADKANVLSVSFDYTIASGTFAAGTQAPGTITPSDITVWIYDVTNSIVTQVSPYVLTGNGANSFHFKGVFQSASNSTSYRLIFHCGTTNTTAFGLKIDNVQVGPQIQILGPAMSDWVSYTPTISSQTGTITNSTAFGQWRRVGDTMEIQVSLQFNNSSVGTWSDPILSLPAGYSIDSTKFANGNGFCVNGQAFFENFGNNAYINAGITTYSSNQLLFFYSTNASGSAISITQAAPFTISSGSYFNGNLIVPIAGWSSNVLMSQDTDTRVVAMYASSNSLQSISTTTQVTGWTATKDTHSGFSSNTYTVPVSGFYKVNSILEWNTQASSARAVIFLYYNGSLFSTGQNTVLNSAWDVSTSLSQLIYCNVGDTLQIYANATTATALTGGSMYWSVDRLSGPAAIAATDSVNMRYTASGTQNLPNNTLTQLTLFTVKTYDSHGAWSGTSYTVPVAGKYRVICQISSNAPFSPAAIGNPLTLQVDHNGSQYSFNTIFASSTSSNNYNVTLADTINCIAGDTISFFGLNSIDSGSLAIGSGEVIMYVSIDRIGN